MPATDMQSPPTLLATLGAALRARRGARGGLVLTTQLVLIYCWHVVAALLSRATNFSNPPGPAADELSLILGSLFAAAGIEGVIAYIPFRLVAGSAKATLSMFARCWWRACAGASVPLVLYVTLSGLLPRFDLALDVMALFMFGWLLLGPSLHARAELLAAPHRASWWPVCPECGYSLRRLARDNCPECGVALPLQSRTFRRWARQRLPWDRLSRGSLLFAYVKTVGAITFSPWAAAPCLAIPDRFSRAMRWAIAQLILVALLGLACGSHAYFVHWISSLWTDRIDCWYLAEPAGYPAAGTVAVWATESAVAWFIAAALLPLLGVLLGAIVPGRHPAAKRGIAKWSLYATWITVPALLLPVGADFVSWLRTAPTPITAQGVTRMFKLPWNPAPPDVWGLAVAYGVWWAAGAAMNPYLRERGARAFVVQGLLFLAAWLVVTKVLFPSAELIWLL